MAEDKKGSALSLSSSLKDDDRFLIITPDNSTGTGYDNRILKWATIKSQIESIATQKAEDAVDGIPTGGTGGGGDNGFTLIVFCFCLLISYILFYLLSFVMESEPVRSQESSQRLSALRGSPRFRW